MTPGESHNEWYQYYCSNICPFKHRWANSRWDPAVSTWRWPHRKTCARIVWSRSDYADRYHMLIAVPCLHCLDATLCMNFQLTICEQQMRIIVYLRSLISPFAVCCWKICFCQFWFSGRCEGICLKLCIPGIFNRNIWDANSTGSGQTCDFQSHQDLLNCPTKN